MHTLLISGHSLKEIRHYSLRQVQGFVELIHAREKLDNALRVTLMRAAYHLDGKKWKSFMRGLE